MTHPSPPVPSSHDEEYSLPCAEALMAGTLALMTGFAQAGGMQRDAMRAKIVANLDNLSGLSTLTPHFRTMLASLRERWGQPWSEAAAGDPCVLWHTAPGRLQ
ncbi:hypothetical protein YS110_21600 [Acidovorax sp. YS12]|nr:hypothetical protein YS110_21600 [Acidovorax sp. YS12]